MKFLTNTQVNEGDLIRVQRSKKYFHYGVVVDNNNVIHFTGPIDDSILNKEEIQIRETSLEQFLRGDKLEVLTPFSSSYKREEITKRVKKHLGKAKFLGKYYNLVTNNCEHFARYVYFGKKESRQVRIVGSALVVATTAVVASGALIKKLKKH